MKYDLIEIQDRSDIYYRMRNWISKSIENFLKRD